MKTHTQYLLIGKITRTKGLHGRMEIALSSPFTSDPLPPFLYIYHPPTYVPYPLLQWNTSGKETEILLDGITHIEEAKQHIGHTLYVTEKGAPRQERHPSQLIGYTLFHQGKALGTIDAVDERTAQTLLYINHHGRDLPIPLASDMIKNICHDSARIDLILPDGYLDVF